MNTWKRWTAKAADAASVASKSVIENAIHPISQKTVSIALFDLATRLDCDCTVQVDDDRVRPVVGMVCETLLRNEANLADVVSKQVLLQSQKIAHGYLITVPASLAQRLGTTISNELNHALKTILRQVKNAAASPLRYWNVAEWRSVLAAALRFMSIRVSSVDVLRMRDRMADKLAESLSAAPRKVLERELAKLSLNVSLPALEMCRSVSSRCRP